MIESENTVHENAAHGEGANRSVCGQLVSDEPRYSLWVSRHDRRMFTVSVQRDRNRQLLTLRSLAVEQVHRAALVRYLRDYRITGKAREQTLREFYGVLDPTRSALAEHRNYLLSASSQLCALDILDMTADKHGADLVRRYQTTYGHFFSMFCDRARARASNRVFLLACLIPEAKTAADRLRKSILEGQLLPRKSLRVVSTSLTRTA
jgi:hypothetical protein